MPVKSPYSLGKLESTRRHHLFRYSDFSLCGTANYDNCTYQELHLRTTIKFTIPADDLNYCQRCRNIAISREEKK